MKVKARFIRKTTKFCLATGKSSHSLGRAAINITIAHNSDNICVPIIDNLNYDFIIGLDTISSFALEQHEDLLIYHKGNRLPYNDLTTSTRATDISSLTTDKLLIDYQDVFKGIGQTTRITHNIKLRVDKVVRHQVQQIPIHWHKLINDHLRELEDLGIIEPSKSEYRSRLVPKKKKDGTLRLAIDYRDLNAITEFDAFPMPNLREIVLKLGKAKVFSKIDLTKGYYQIPLGQSSKKYTAFAFDGKLFQFRVLPFGLAAAPQTFQRLMESILGHLPFVECYLDDVIIFSKDESEHTRHLTEVLRIVKEENIKLNEKKCSFALTEVDFLGFRMGAGSRGITSHNKMKLLNFPRPTKPAEATTFVCMAGYYRDIFPNFATLAIPLYDCGNKKKFEWSQKEEESFTKIKEMIKHDPTLRIPRPEVPFIVTTDASEVGMGGVLAQDIEGTRTPVDFFSSKWSKPQRNYATVEKEATAIIQALRHWRHFLLGAPFRIESDHKPLQWLMTKKDVSGKLGRLALELQEYPIENITYIKGHENILADTLSRTQVEMLTINNINGDTSPELELAINKDPTRFVNINNKWFLKEVSAIGERLRLCITRDTDKKKITNETHEAGHFGKYKCQEFIRNRFWWPGWQRDVEKTVKQCTRCASFKSDEEKTRLPLIPSQLPSRHWARIGVDLAGKWTTSNQGNSYVLAVQDYYSKLLLAKPLKDIKTTTIIDELKKIFREQGSPEEMIVDCGAQFESREFKTFITLTKIQLTFASVGHHQSNGLIERGIRTIETMLRTSGDEQKNWDVILPRVVTAYNNTPHHSTGMSPHLLAYGVEATTQLDKHFSINPVPVDKKALHRNFIDQSRKHQRHQKQQYDKRSKMEQLKVDGLVLWHVPAQDLGSSRKLNRKWRGPFRVIKFEGPNACIADHHNNKRWIHKNHLKAYPGPASAPLETIRNRGRPRLHRTSAAPLS